jgi:hypothetical protein
MATLDLDAEWQRILDQCPQELCALAKETGAVKRWRNVSSGSELLRLALSYALGDLSLRSTAGCMTAQDIALADTSVLDRLRAAPPFLEAVLAHLLSGRESSPHTPPSGMRACDATIVSVPGSTGIDWRLHTAFDPGTARLRAVEITDGSVGERLSRYELRPGDLALGDRGLGTAQGVHFADRKDAFSLLRVHLSNLGRHLSPAGRHSLSPKALARRAGRGHHETDVWLADPDCEGKRLRARLIVARLSRAAAHAARARCLREARKDHRVPREGTLVLAGLLVLLTTVPRGQLSAEQALSLYRARYQVELFFKRSKSLLDLDLLRAKDPKLVRTYLLAKLIAIALTECRVDTLQGFSPLCAAA